MVKLSDDLVWAVVGKRNAHMVQHKRLGKKFTAEPGNLTAQHGRKFSVYMSKSVGASDDGKGNTTLTLATKAAGSKPSKGKHSVKLNAYGRGTSKTTKTVKKLLEEQFYRPDLAQTAAARLARSASAAQAKTRGVKYAPKKRSNK